MKYLLKGNIWYYCLFKRDVVSRLVHTCVVLRSAVCIVILWCVLFIEGLRRYYLLMYIGNLMRRKSGLHRGCQGGCCISLNFENFMLPPWSQVLLGASLAIDFDLSILHVRVNIVGDWGETLSPFLKNMCCLLQNHKYYGVRMYVKWTWNTST